MDLEKSYPRTVFNNKTIKSARARFFEVVGDLDADAPSRAKVRRGEELWSFDNLDEFFAERERGFVMSSLSDYQSSKSLSDWAGFSIDDWNSRDPYGHLGTTVTVRGLDRQSVSAVFAVFDEAAEDAFVPMPEAPTKPPPPPPVIFIGHGGDPQWMELKNHLADLHGFEVRTFESGARSGHTIRDVLESIGGEASIAFLVLTGEDLQADGGTRARQNVVHELGLFQGMLGFRRGIAIVEEGVEVFSNLDGVHQIRFGKGNIREAFGDAVATLKRELSPGE